MRYLGYHSRSAAEVRQYLSRRGYSRGAVDAATARLRSLNYLNDENFARDWALDRAESRGYGPGRIEQELRVKGIDAALAREAVRGAFEQVDESQQARKLLDKRFRGGDFADPRTLRRAAAFLQRRGYSSNVLSNLLGCFVEDD